MCQLSRLKDWATRWSVGLLHKRDLKDLYTGMRAFGTLAIASYILLCKVYSLLIFSDFGTAGIGTWGTAGAHSIK